MKINVVCTLDIQDEEFDSKQEIIEKAYEEFEGIIEDAYKSRDLTGFQFVNADTGIAIEDEDEYM